MATHPEKLTDWIAHHAGDSTLIIEFGQQIDRQIVARVNALDAHIQHAIGAGQLVGVSETVPTFRSLAIIYDPLIIHPDTLLAQLQAALNRPEATTHGHSSDQTVGRHWQLPVLYGTRHGPDLSDVARMTGLADNTVIDLHLGTRFTVYMLGFLPGFAFLGDTPGALHLPRRKEPRLRVPAGSVAIAMQLTGVYPWDSPGGWHIIGNCPVPFFNAAAYPPALFKASDTVSFRRIDDQEFDDLSRELSTTTSPYERWLASNHDELA